VSIAHAQPAEKWGKVRSDPQNGYQRTVLHRHRNAIEGGELVRCAVEHAFSTRAIVATDVDDQGVVELAEVFD
jgi:hypothetical protein